MESRLKLITATTSEFHDVLYINSKNYLQYETVDEDGTVVTKVLDKGGTVGNRLVKCSDLKKVLDTCLIKGTKFIINIYNPTLYYLIPGIQENDRLFTSKYDFILQ